MKSSYRIKGVDDTSILKTSERCNGIFRFQQIAIDNGLRACCKYDFENRANKDLQEKKEGNGNVFADELTGIHFTALTIARLVMKKGKKRYILQTGGTTVGKATV